MTNPKHTDTSRSVTTLTAPTLSVVGTFVPPSAVTFFDGDSVIRINRNGTLELGPKWADAGDAAAAFFNELVSRVVPSWNARIEALVGEAEGLRGALQEIIAYSQKHIDDTDAYTMSRHKIQAARAALGEK